MHGHTLREYSSQKKLLLSSSYLFLFYTPFNFNEQKHVQWRISRKHDMEW